MGAVEVDISDVLEGTRLMAARARNLRPVLRQMRRWMAQATSEQGAARQGPEGPWAPPARSTLERALAGRGQRRARGKRKGELTKRGAKTAARLGTLGRFAKGSAYRFIVEPQAITMQARGAWAGIHQYGGVAGHGAKIPARPFLWISDALIGRATGAILDHIHDGWRR